MKKRKPISDVLLKSNMPISYHTKWCWNCKQQEGRWVSITCMKYNTHSYRVMKHACLLQQRRGRQLQIFFSFNSMRAHVECEELLRVVRAPLRLTN